MACDVSPVAMFTIIMILFDNDIIKVSFSLDITEKEQIPLQLLFHNLWVSIEQIETGICPNTAEVVIFLIKETISDGCINIT